MARIRCLLERPGGTVVELTDGPRRGYHFKPSDDCHDHVAEVTNPAHIQRFLDITEGYALADGEDVPAGVSIPEAAEPVAAGDEEVAPDAMPNRELSSWCRDHGLDFRHRDGLREYAARMGVSLSGVHDRTADIARALVKAERERDAA